MPAKLTAATALAVASLASGVAAYAQDYPSRPVTLVVPFAPGGSIDIVGRMLGEQLSGRLGKPFIVENRPGGGTNVATVAVARAAPDGHTLLITTSSLAINPTLYKKLAYNPANDFAPVALVANIPLVLVVNPSLPVKSARDLVAFAREQAGRLSYASGGSGSAPHLAGELFKSMAAIDMTHVPYRGAPLALSDVVAGHVQVMFADPGTALPQIRDGKVRALGVTSPTAVPGIPDIPPIAQTGVPGYDAVSWQLLVAPAKTPPDIVDRLHAEIKNIAARPAIETRFAGLGLAPVQSPSPKALQRFVSSELQRWGEIVRRAGVAGSE
jgi:tripartite-type tricarboxylate transporter receptor subunit TctC